jgi:hypothetical protein
MDDDHFAAVWRRCNIELDEARAAYHAVIIGGDKAAKQAAARRLWECIAKTLTCYSDPSNWPEGIPQDAATIGPLPRHTLSPLLATMLSSWSQYLAAGQVPNPMLDVRGPGRPGIGPYERDHQLMAVAYIAAVRADLIEDPHPVKTTAEAFRVTERAVQKWIAEYWFIGPGAFGPPDRLIDAFKKAASTYGVHGRGAKATGPRRAKMKEADRHERRAAKKRTQPP